MPTTAEPTPGCLIVLIAQSAAMAGDVRVRIAHREIEGEPEIRELPRGFAARFLADELLEALVNTHAAGYAVPLEVAVIGYSADADGAVKFESLLPDGKPRVQLLPLAEVAELPVEPRARSGDPRKWTVPFDYAGPAAAAAALDEVHRLVSVWMTGRYHVRPPVIIHCTGGEGLDADYACVAHSLGLLATASGPTRLLHVGFVEGVEPSLNGPDAASPVESCDSLQELTALPGDPGGWLARHAVSVNDWSIEHFWNALFLFAAMPEVVLFEPVAGRVFATVRELWTQKLGNEPHEWEDAFAADAKAGVAVVADGASSGIYCRLWADQLAKRFVADRPNPRDPVALAKWVNGLREEWRTEIDYPALSWTKQRKVDETGAAATLLALEVGALGADGTRPWRAFAVGDACLFWMRDGALLASFPVLSAEQFGSAPLLVRSNAGYRTLGLAAAGDCRPGDRFLLATDAVAARLLHCRASGSGPGWYALESIDEDAWRHEMDTLRKTSEMVNDDCTLVALRIMGAEEPLDFAEPEEPPLADMQDE